jgi:hypothetical protein
VIDVFDTFGKWEEQLALPPKERFDALTIDPDGTLYLYAPAADHVLFKGDVSSPEGPPPAATPGPARTGARSS